MRRGIAIAILFSIRRLLDRRTCQCPGQACWEDQGICQHPARRLFRGTCRRPQREVSVLVGPGQDPHTFEPTPKLMTKLADAQVPV